MKYTIVVDKQSRSNPSKEAREYTFECEELRKKGDIQDEIIIVDGGAKHIQRIGLTEYNVSYLLDKEIITELGNTQIKLFEGTNYIYIKDEYNNQMCAEYLIKNDFTDMYVTNLQMKSAIEESADKISLSVDKVLQGYSTTEEMKSAINIKSNEINLELAKKVNEETITGAYLILKINGDKSEAKLSADKIELSANDILNLLSGNTINMSGKKIKIVSTNFNVDENGNMIAKSGEIGGFVLGTTAFTGNLKGIYNYDSYDLITCSSMAIDLLSEKGSWYDIYDVNGDGSINSGDMLKIQKILIGQEVNDKQISGTLKIDSKNPKHCLSIKKNGQTMVSLGVNGINTKLLTTEGIICGFVNGTTLDGVVIDGKNGEICCVASNSTQTYINASGIRTPVVTQTSLKSKKKNIKKLNINATDLIKNADICNYNLKEEKARSKKHIGLVIGDGYNCPDEVISEDKQGVEQYSMTTLAWKAIQEQQKIIEQLQEKVARLEEQNG